MRYILLFLIFAFSIISAETFENNYGEPTMIVQIFAKDTLVKAPLITKSIRKTNKLGQNKSLSFINAFNDTITLYYTYFGDSKIIKTISYANKKSHKKRINLYSIDKKLLKKDIFLNNKLYRTIIYTSNPPKVINYEK